jgi:hypothetical protein
MIRRKLDLSGKIIPVPDPNKSVLIHHHHRRRRRRHISVMELGHLLTRSGLTCPEVSSKVCHDSFCQMGSSVTLPWVICYEAFCLHVVSSLSCTPVLINNNNNKRALNEMFIKAERRSRKTV